MGPSSLTDVGPYPNTDAIQLPTVRGDPTRTAVTIYNISESGDMMTFSVSFKETLVVRSTPTTAPAVQPPTAASDGVLKCIPYSVVNTSSAVVNTVTCAFVACGGSVLTIMDAE